MRDEPVDFFISYDADESYAVLNGGNFRLQWRLASQGTVADMQSFLRVQADGNVRIGDAFTASVWMARREGMVNITLRGAESNSALVQLDLTPTVVDSLLEALSDELEES